MKPARHNAYIYICAPRLPHRAVGLCDPMQWPGQRGALPDRRGPWIYDMGISEINTCIRCLHARTDASYATDRPTVKNAQTCMCIQGRRGLKPCFILKLPMRAAPDCRGWSAFNALDPRDLERSPKLKGPRPPSPIPLPPPPPQHYPAVLHLTDWYTTHCLAHHSLAFNHGRGYGKQPRFNELRVLDGRPLA